MAADPRRLYREIVDVEKQLRELLRSNPLNALDANALRSRLIDSARALAQASPTFAAQRELEQVLWKPCFYKRIEDFRRRIRKYAAAPANDRSVREHFARVSHEFQAFLNDASSFYESLRAAFTAWLLQHRVSRIASSASASLSAGPASAAEMQANTDKCRASLFRCLVFLGDLARYRELHSQKAKKNFVAAETFYHRALAVMPENGNPHNQLAVLATYVEAETVAVYRYCRSLLIAQPFATADENLALLFERSRQRPLAPPTTAVVSATSSSKDKSGYLKSFLHRLTRMHGTLFSLASASASASTSAPATAPVPVYSKEMESLLMKDLATLLATGIVGDALLLKLVVTNIFCLVRAAGTPAVYDAMRLSVRMVTVVMDFLMAEFPKMDAKKTTPHKENGHGGASASQLPNALRLLAAVSTFCDFLRLNTKYLDALDAMVSRADDADLGKRSAKAMLESLAALLNHHKIQSVVHSAAGEQANVLLERQLQLKENIELRGFQPLSALVDAGAANKWRDDLAASNPAASASALGVSDQDAWKTRAWNVHSFGNFLCEDYEGNPLLYCYKGQFATSPTVVSGIANGFTIAPATATASMGLFGVASAPSASNGPTPVASTPVDDFDDEIIVYQPSPALAPSQPQPLRSSFGNSVLSGGGGGSTGPLTSPFGSDPFSLSTSASPFGNPAQPPSQQQPLQQRLSLSTPSSVFGSFGTTASTSDTNQSAIGSSLGYGGFQSFGALGSGTSFAGPSAFSGQGFLSAGWGNAATQGSSGSVTSLAGAFASASTEEQPLSSGAGFRGSATGSLFGDMDDLAAVERESLQYQQKASSLSAFLGASSLTPSKTQSAIGSLSPLPTTRSASMGSALRTAPPPGFATQSPPPPPQQQQQPFFTRSPFTNP